MPTYLHLPTSLAFAILLAASFAGWGRLVGGALLGPGEGDLGERIGWGIAATVGLAGLANLFGRISPALLALHAGIGLALFGADGVRLVGRTWGGLDRPPGRWGGALVALVGTLTLVRLLDACHAEGLERLDDHQAYLAFPVQMLQTGSLTRDPFCARRIESALGGMSALTAFGVAALAPEDARAVDLGVGLIGTLAAAAGLARSRGLIGWAWLPLTLLVLLDRPIATNLSALSIPTALLLTVHRTLGRDDRRPGRAVLLGGLASALVALKSSLIPLVFFVFLLDGLPRLGRRATWRTFPVEVAVGLICLAPWMVAQRQSSGTYLYPILGKGVHGSRYGTFLRPNAEFTPASIRRGLFRGMTDPQVVATFALGLAAFVGRTRPRSGSEPDAEGDGGWRPEDAGLVLAPWPSLVLLLTQFDPTLAIRYADPILPAASIVALGLILRRSADPRREARNVLVGVALFAFFAGARWPETRYLYQGAFANIRSGLAARPYVTAEDRARYAAMQASVPPGEPILTHLSLPFLLDFRRNPIYLADWPGGASPPPGLPSFRGAGALAAYLLRAQGVRYVAYSRGDRANIPRVEVEPGPESTWVRTVFRHAWDFQDSLAELASTRRTPFDDGVLVVIDLGSPAGAPP